MLHAARGCEAGGGHVVARQGRRAGKQFEGPRRLSRRDAETRIAATKNHPAGRGDKKAGRMSSSCRPPWKPFPLYPTLIGSLCASSGELTPLKQLRPTKHCRQAGRRPRSCREGWGC